MTLRLGSSTCKFRFLFHKPDHADSRPPPQHPSQGYQPSSSELLNSITKKLDLLQAKFDLSVGNNEVLTSLVQTQQQQMNIHLERVNALSTELELHKDSIKRKDQEDKSSAPQVLSPPAENYPRLEF